jgi:23S rRNA (adenine2503-C2)-methyltransferase
MLNVDALLPHIPFGLPSAPFEDASISKNPYIKGYFGYRASVNLAERFPRGYTAATVEMAVLNEMPGYSARQSKIDILGLTRDGLKELADKRLGPAAGAYAKVYAQAFKRFELNPSALGLGNEKVLLWTDNFSLKQPEIERVLTEPGEYGSTAKALLRLEDGLRVECVRVPMATRSPDEGRGTLCVSSQVGCRMGCAFCETGRMGLKRSLTSAEIVGQVLAARLLLGWPFRNIVFMGMGEPLDNAKEVFQAIEVLQDSAGLNFAQDRLSLCTVGHAEGLRLLAAKGWKRLNLSVSLNAATDEARSAIMAVNRRWPLPELSEALRLFRDRRGFTLALNYCLIPGRNDSAQDADAVAAFVNGLEFPREAVFINVIPYNPGSAPIGREPTAAETEGFVAALKGRGLRVLRRATHGRSIMAACGQLGAEAPSA